MAGRRLARMFVLIACCLRIGVPMARAETYAIYYVRPDGGSAAQCTGLVDAPYPGSGVNQPCAWNHPFQALPPGGEPRIKGGDMLRISPGSYRLGLGAPGAEACSADYAWDCVMPPLPGGPDADHPTRITGAGGDGICVQPPELWGAERAHHLLDLSGAEHVVVECLELTDHSGCVTFHGHAFGGSDWTCQRDAFPFGDWAAIGLYAQDAVDVVLRDVNIHGLAELGVNAGRLRDWALERARIVGNGWAGWDGDIDGADSNHGTLYFTQVQIAWNGCVEGYPDGKPVGCWGQTAGGYGDGLGTGHTAGDWRFTDCQFLHNTSDGLDMLYHDQGGRVTLERVRAEGNAGNQVKVAGRASITNSVLVGNCAFFQGQPFTYHVDHCRALGNTLSMAYIGGETIQIVNSTLYGQGDGLIGAGPRQDGDCIGSERAISRNNILLGDGDWNSDGDITFHFYQEGCGDLRLDSDYSIAYRTKNIICGSSGPQVESGLHDLCLDPLVNGPLSGPAYGLRLTAASPALGVADPAWAPMTDHDGALRDGRPDRGAYEWLAAGQRLHLPMVLRG